MKSLGLMEQTNSHVPVRLKYSKYMNTQQLKIATNLATAVLVSNPNVDHCRLRSPELTKISTAEAFLVFLYTSGFVAVFEIPESL